MMADRDEENPSSSSSPPSLPLSTSFSSVSSQPMMTSKRSLSSPRISSSISSHSMSHSMSHSHLGGASGGGGGSRDRPPLITGLDRVWSGEASAAEAVVLYGRFRPPRYAWYVVSGSSVDVWQLFVDRVVLHRTLGVSDPSTCWALSFTASIAVRHSFHARLVFGNFVGGYWHSLGRMYGGYSFSIVASTLFNYVLTSYGATGAMLAWVVTFLWTGIFNYFMLQRLWTFHPPSSSTTTTTLASGSLPSSTSLSSSSPSLSSFTKNASKR